MSEFLVIGGTRVPIAAPNGADEEYQEYGGEVVRSFSGSLLSTVKGRARVWRLQTPPLPDSEAQVLAAVLAHGSPLMCSGALIGSGPVSCYVRGVRTRPFPPLSRLRRVVEFELHEAAPMASPILFRLHAGEPLAAGMSFSRASPAWYFDRDGILREAEPDVPRVEWLDSATPAWLIERGTTNHVRNPRAEGAVVGPVGAGGALPTHWGVDTAGGLTWEVVGTGVEDGLPYVDLRAHGTPTGTVSQIRLETYTGITAAPGQTWTGSLYVRRVGGSMDGVGGVHVGVQERAGGTFLADTVVTVDAEAARLSDARAVCTRTTNNAATTNALLVAGLSGLTPGVPVDSTLRIAGPQMEQSPVASSLVLPPVGAPAVSTRAPESLVAPYTRTPGPLAIYVRLRGRSGLLLDREPNLVMVGGGADRVQIQTDTAENAYQIRYTSGGTNRFRTLAAPGPTDDVELLLTLDRDGVARLSQSIEGAPATSVAATPLALPSAWGAQTITIGGHQALRDLLVLDGADWTMDAVRRLVR